MNNEGRNFIMPFGKHEGETLEEIYVDDKRYLDWCLDNIEDEQIIEAIEQCFEEMKLVKF